MLAGNFCRLSEYKGRLTERANGVFSRWIWLVQYKRNFWWVQCLFCLVLFVVEFHQKKIYYEWKQQSERISTTKTKKKKTLVCTPSGIKLMTKKGRQIKLHMQIGLGKKREKRKNTDEDARNQIGAVRKSQVSIYREYIDIYATPFDLVIGAHWVGIKLGKFDSFHSHNGRWSLFTFKFPFIFIHFSQIICEASTHGNHTKNRTHSYTQQLCSIFAIWFFSSPDFYSS